MANFISEDQIEQALLTRLRDQFGYALLNCYTVNADDLINSILLWNLLCRKTSRFQF